MKKLLSLLLVVGLLSISSYAYAQERYTPLKSSGVITSVTNFRDYGIDIYRIMFNATAATAGLGLYDAACGIGPKPADAATVTDVVFEIYEATSGEGHYIDFGDNPLKLKVGCRIQVFDAAVVLHYR